MLSSSLQSHTQARRHDTRNFTDNPSTSLAQYDELLPTEGTGIIEKSLTSLGARKWHHGTADREFGLRLTSSAMVKATRFLVCKPWIAWLVYISGQTQVLFWPLREVNSSNIHLSLLIRCYRWSPVNKNVQTKNWKIQIQVKLWHTGHSRRKIGVWTVVVWMANCSMHFRRPP